MCKVHALSVPSANAPFERTMIERRVLRPDDVLIDIKYSGVCHTDVHMVHNDGGYSQFPMVPGHEMTGIVEAVGTEVTKFVVGDRVGVGPLVNSCGECENCLRGENMFCKKGMVMMYNSVDYDGNITYGSYSQKIVVKQNYVLQIPDSLGLDVASPLLCAGATAYYPLKHWGVGPGKKVAIVGIGGIGHLAIKYAHALGAEVTALSQTMDKKSDALSFGADHYYATNDPDTFSTLASQFDVIFNTTSASLNLDAYVSMLNINGTFVIIGDSGKPNQFNTLSLLMGRRRIAATPGGDLLETQEMLDFSAEHGIVPEIEVIHTNQINEAFERLIRNDVRYRFVIDTSTF
ncbi:NAD(P)-dependent alcohol dehydrogenase [Paenibacillus polymyxa]|uniref:NAD(P)-dependent alcohol dehydrogenase n=1 Tax=Paenibacillus TaxID=44249 RepID=UPI0002FBC0D1|nr:MULTISPECIES: NAD(P)-dependent alcohol dehydrogenase [Paenibacillus]KAF6658990.1 NAD(P)-dependent alcohol dehydrogenase [Paenibacillus sp. EKM301P]KKD53652.1 alcohol dehydrogenase [Paenibacillus sp. ICGEB2008]MBE3649494.1 NAD(P)-dependent alcohol dehydrogenase [Paenibacillus polymyxa]MEE4577102.1 NAD(P)-dependent alcohol dehydrogenase [Paenibacillus polymyxa]RPE02665.1 NAD(P)-dependent alcohol dehydrogenase [Paenibacillus polymyxa]